ncbi:hypothetical protein HF521_011197, partial [Silurus meridionalis]
VISAYAPQVGCEMEEKERFWSELDEVVDGVPRKERLVIGADFNGHVGEGNRGDEEVMVQESIRRKRLAKQKWDRQSDEKSRQEYKEMRQQVKRMWRKPRKRHMRSCIRGWTLRKEKRIYTDWPGRGTELERMYCKLEQ